MTVGLKSDELNPAQDIAEQINRMRADGLIVTNVDICADNGCMYALVDVLEEDEVMSCG